MVNFRRYGAKVMIQDSFAGKYSPTGGTRVRVCGMDAQAMFHLEENVTKYAGAIWANRLRFCSLGKTR